MLDSSPQVREAAVELIGKYMVDSPSVAGDYYQKIAERIAVGRHSAIQIPRSYIILGHGTRCSQTCYQASKGLLFRDRRYKPKNRYLYEAGATYAR